MLNITLFVIFILKYGKCYKTSVCLQNNEEFSLCGWKCPVTCINIRLLKMPLTFLCPGKWECYVGCRCSAGFVRDEYSKDCVTIQNCPATMKVVSILVFAFATSAAGAPTIITSIPEYLQEANRQILRDKRSKYGHGYYSYTAASSPIASYTPYQWNLPVQNYLNPYAYGYQTLFPGCGRGYYRTEDHHNEQEMASFSDKEREHQTASRTAVDATSNPSSLPGIGQLVTPTNGSAYGVFSNVPNAGCNVPLLFSCSPSIVPGRIVKASPRMDYGFGPYGFRGVEDMAYEPQGSYHEEHAVHDNVGTGGSAVDADHIGHQ